MHIYLIFEIWDMIIYQEVSPKAHPFFKEKYQLKAFITSAFVCMPVYLHTESYFIVLNCSYFFQILTIVYQDGSLQFIDVSS